jgi:hypothetical protein
MIKQLTIGLAAMLLINTLTLAQAKQEWNSIFKAMKYSKALKHIVL